MPDHDYYTIPDLARLMTVHTNTVRGWIRKHGLPAYKAGIREYRIDKAAFAAWRTANGIAAPKEEGDD